jgi:hypothetical protein
MEAIKLIECPRDAIQGYQTPIDTTMKIAYYQMLLKGRLPYLGLW